MGIVHENISGRLVAAIAETDFAAVRENSFTGSCPSDNDGPQYLYRFVTAAGIEGIDSCETDIEGLELFLNIDVILGHIYGRLSE